MYPQEERLIEVIPYRNNGVQALIFCVLFLPASIFITYTPFKDPCSLNRTSGDCSLGSLFMEQVYTIFMVGLGIVTIAACLLIIRKYYRSLKPHKGCRIAFTNDSIVGPIWGLWKSLEEELKFSEIKELAIIQNRYGVIMMIIATPHRKMILQHTFLKDHDDFKRVYNQLAKNLGKPSFEETASPEVLKALVPYGAQIEKQKHLFSAFIYFSIGGALTLIFGSHGENQNNSDVFLIAFFIPLIGLGYISSKFYKEVWTSNVGPIVLFLFLMLFGLFLGFIGTIGLLGYFGY